MLEARYESSRVAPSQPLYTEKGIDSLVCR